MYFSLRVGVGRRGRIRGIPRELPFLTESVSRKILSNLDLFKKEKVFNSFLLQKFSWFQAKRSPCTCEVVCQTCSIIDKTPCVNFAAATSAFDVNCPNCITTAIRNLCPTKSPHCVPATRTIATVLASSTRAGSQ